MSKNRVLYVLIGVALLVTSFSLWQVVSSQAAVPAQADRSYDAIENIRSYSRAIPRFAASKPQADSSYDAVESIRGSRSLSSAIGQADRSYDGIENIRQNRISPAAALQGGKCPDGECSYQLTNGQWAR